VGVDCRGSRGGRGAAWGNGQEARGSAGDAQVPSLQGAGRAEEEGAEEEGADSTCVAGAREKRSSQRFKATPRFKEAARALGEQVRQLREARGLTLEQASALMDVDLKHLRRSREDNST